MHSGRLSSHLLGRLLQLESETHSVVEKYQYWHEDGGTIISRSVTSCAGMTAYLVLLAQTRVGFLSGEREKLPSTSSTRTGGTKGRSLCTSYCCSYSSTTNLLYHGSAGHVWVGRSSYYHRLFEVWCILQWTERTRWSSFSHPSQGWRTGEAPDDSAFLQSLRHSCARVNGVYPPMSLIEAYITEDDSAPRVRRLHLIVVDRVWRILSNLQIDQHAAETLHTLPIPVSLGMSLVTRWMAATFRAIFYGPYGHLNPSGASMPGKEIRWLDRCDHMAPLDIEDFFDAFCFEAKRPKRCAFLPAGLRKIHILNSWMRLLLAVPQAHPSWEENLYRQTRC